MDNRCIRSIAYRKHAYVINSGFISMSVSLIKATQYFFNEMWLEGLFGVDAKLPKLWPTFRVYFIGTKVLTRYDGRKIFHSSSTPAEYVRLTKSIRGAFAHEEWPVIATSVALTGIMDIVANRRDNETNNIAVHPMSPITGRLRP